MLSTAPGTEHDHNLDEAVQPLIGGFMRSSFDKSSPKSAKRCIEELEELEGFEELIMAWIMSLVRRVSRPSPLLPPFTDLAWSDATQPSQRRTEDTRRYFEFSFNFFFASLFRAFTKGFLCRYALLHPSPSRRPDSTVVAVCSCSFLAQQSIYLGNNLPGRCYHHVSRKVSNAGCKDNQCCTRKEPKKLL